MVVLVLEPVRELDGISNRRRKKQKPDVLREKRKREFPDDPTLRVVEIMELIHHDRLNVTKFIEFLRVEQPVEKDLGHNDQDLRVRVHFVISRHQPNIVLGKAPTDGRLAQLAEFLVRQRDQRCGVVHALAGLKGLVNGGLGDERLSRPGRRADQYALRRGKPRQKRLFLNRVKFIRDRFQIFFRYFVASKHFIQG